MGPRGHCPSYRWRRGSLSPALSRISPRILRLGVALSRRLSHFRISANALRSFARPGQPSFVDLDSTSRSKSSLGNFSATQVRRMPRPRFLRADRRHPRRCRNYDLLPRGRLGHKHLVLPADASRGERFSRFALRFPPAPAPGSASQGGARSHCPGCYFPYALWSYSDSPLESRSYLRHHHETRCPRRLGHHLSLCGYRYFQALLSRPNRVDDDSNGRASASSKSRRPPR